MVSRSLARHKAHPDLRAHQPHHGDVDATVVNDRAMRGAQARMKGHDAQTVWKKLGGEVLVYIVRTLYFNVLDGESIRCSSVY